MIVGRTCPAALSANIRLAKDSNSDALGEKGHESTLFLTGTEKNDIVQNKFENSLRLSVSSL